MKENSLFDLVNQVEDEKTFLCFIKALWIDREKFVCENTEDRWENHTIEDFLEAAYSWGEESENGLEYYDKPNNPWKRTAQILYMGKIYE
jgi:hypothetical protein